MDALLVYCVRNRACCILGVRPFIISLLIILYSYSAVWQFRFWRNIDLVPNIHASINLVLDTVTILCSTAYICAN